MLRCCCCCEDPASSETWPRSHRPSRSHRPWSQNDWTRHCHGTELGDEKRPSASCHQVFLQPPQYRAHQLYHLAPAPSSLQAGMPRGGAATEVKQAATIPAAMKPLKGSKCRAKDNSSASTGRCLLASLEGLLPNRLLSRTVEASRVSWRLRVLAPLLPRRRVASHRREISAALVFGSAQVAQALVSRPLTSLSFAQNFPRPRRCLQHQLAPGSASQAAGMHPQRPSEADAHAPFLGMLQPDEAKTALSRSHFLYLPKTAHERDSTSSGPQQAFFWGTRSS